MSNANQIFDSVFRLDLAKSAVPSGSELMARTGLRENGTDGPGRTGRPASPPDEPTIRRLRLNVDPDNPTVTALALDPDDEMHWLSGSVVRVVFADGSERSIVLMDDVRIADWLNE